MGQTSLSFCSCNTRTHDGVGLKQEHELQHVNFPVNQCCTFSKLFQLSQISLAVVRESIVLMN